MYLCGCCCMIMYVVASLIHSPITCCHRALHSPEIDPQNGQELYSVFFHHRQKCESGPVWCVADPHIGHCCHYGCQHHTELSVPLEAVLPSRWGLLLNSPLQSYLIHSTNHWLCMFEEATLYDVVYKINQWEQWKYSYITNSCCSIQQQ